MTSAQRPAGATGFDFLIGSWHVKNERLTSRLSGSHEWEQFEALHDAWPLLHGFGNIDRMRAQWRGLDFEGCSLRIFNPDSGLWSIYWVDNVSFELGPPVVGRFEDGVGEFFGDDQQEERAVRVRFRWSDITAHSARWEQAFSDDGGETWELNWIMTFTRRSASEPTEVRA